jgi:hypothetical protein
VNNPDAERFEELLFSNLIDFHLEPSRDTALTTAYVIENEARLEDAEKILYEALGRTRP